MRWRVLIPSVCLSFFVLVAYFLGQPEDRGQLVDDARNALRSGLPSVALRKSREALRSDPIALDALMIAAFASADLGDFRRAVSYCMHVPRESGRAYADAQCMAGRLYLNHLSVASESETAFLRALEVAPNHQVALQGLAHLLSVQTRSRELLPIQLQLIRQGIITTDTVMSLVNPDRLFPDRGVLSRLRGREPDHPGLLLAEARLATLRNDFDQAESFLRRALDLDATMDEAYARLGELLVQSRSTEALQRWQRSLPESAMKSPEIWVTLGYLYEQEGSNPKAGRCYWEAGIRDASLLSANYGLGRQLSLLGRTAEAEKLLDRARAMERYRRLFDHPPDSSVQFAPDQLKEAMEAAMQLGLSWEGYALARLAQQMAPTAQWAIDATSQLSGELSQLPLKRTNPGVNVFRSFDTDEFPLPELTADFVEKPELVSERLPPCQARFEEVGESVGLRFLYENGVAGSISGAQRPYDFTGGGIAVVDFDSDGWPDLFFSQGCTLDGSTGPTSTDATDQLFQNVDGGQFICVTDLSLAPDLDYSQGVSAGDVNNDGFVDLFIANLGPNRLIINNGDGTFRESSSAIQSDAEAWTTSCLVCDLNGDECPDLYSVNYLKGDIVSRICRNANGPIASCAPQDFAASYDQIHISDGAGRFTDVTGGCGIHISQGKGLGIVAADLDEDHCLDLYVANDGVPNFLFERDCGRNRLTFTEVGMTRGVAVNIDGLSEASMGIIVEDLDSDRRLDLFVTNFLDETNTLYAGTASPGFFVDHTWKSGLGPPSLPTLGFGAQTLDAELDGFPDIVVANGHVDDFSERGVKYRMAPQYFSNTGNMRFVEQPASVVGQCFAENDLGRSVARLDWDRDGDEEVVIGSLVTRYSLLRNVSSAQGNRLSISLKATLTQRDAIGSLVTVTSSGTTLARRQLVAGDGYMASNERLLVFGLGKNVAKVDVHVIWPGGKQQSFNDVEVDEAYVAIESCDRLYSTWLFPRRD